MIRERTSSQLCVDFCLAPLVRRESGVHRAGETLMCTLWAFGGRYE